MAESEAHRSRWFLKVGLPALLVLCLIGVAYYEIRTSAIQSFFVSRYAKRELTFAIRPGPSKRIVFPQAGPFDEARGYTALPALTQRLEQRGFRVREQAVFSPELERISRLGISPPYLEPQSAGLSIRSREGWPVYDSSWPTFTFKRFKDIPPILRKALLYLEDRHLLAKQTDSRANPVVDWKRLARASLSYVKGKLGLEDRIQGGSTLATQLEKYRHSARGRTESPLSKLRQMISASLRVYRQGPDTRAAREGIVLEYMNSLPLASVAGHGEVHGLGEGLYAWFGQDPRVVQETLAAPGWSRAKRRAFKHALALLYAARAPGNLLVRDHDELDRGVNTTLEQLAKGGVIEPAAARKTAKVRLAFSPTVPPRNQLTSAQKTANLIRNHLLALLEYQGTYDLDRLHLEVETSLDVQAQEEVGKLFDALQRDDYLEAHGLRAERLLESGDPRHVRYSLVLFESTTEGNLLRVQTDNIDAPFDLSGGAKLELGSTAKLRTLSHYLEIAASLHQELSRLKPAALEARERRARDPLTRFAAQTLLENRGMTLASFLEQAIARTYPASPEEAFFTGGGIHRFSNFDPLDDERVVSVRDALVHSVNLVFVRLMRDLVGYHEARLPYDVEVVLSQPGNPVRRRLLEESADDESRDALKSAHGALRDRALPGLVETLLGPRAKSPRHLAMLFFAWHGVPAEPRAELSRWLSGSGAPVTPGELDRLVAAYGRPKLTLADFGFLLDLHPLEIWSGAQLAKDPSLTWEALLARSAAARRISSKWLFHRRNTRAQDLRLRIRFEQDAFARMTPYWQKLCFPFERLVPSYATALGSSSDRPSALAELMGVIVNKGMRRPMVRVQKLIFASGTPYHTVFEPVPAEGERVMNPAVAALLSTVLQEVVELGTARRVAGAFAKPDGTPVAVGGKTGSGDNRIERVDPQGERIDSRPVSRTATFVFYLGDRYFGTLTAYVAGAEAGGYGFTSALPVSVLKLLSPALDLYPRTIESIRRPDSVALSR